MKKVIMNTLKISIGAVLAIVIASLFHLGFAYSAGIITILTILNTKKETIHTALQRFIAFLLALIIAYASYSLFGYGLLGFSIYLILYVFVCQYYKWYSSMAVNSVLISHFVTFGVFDKTTLINEAMLFVIGIMIGIIANMHLHKDVDYMNALKSETDEEIKALLIKIAQRIMKEDHTSIHDFERLNFSITKAKAVSIENENNSILYKDNFDSKYIRMREHQSHILYEMYKVVKSIETSPFTAKTISDFLYKISLEYHSDNDCEKLLEEFYSIDMAMKETKLPQTRIEFENRARLFSLLRLIEEFLLEKNKFYHEKKDSFES